MDKKEDMQVQIYLLNEINIKLQQRIGMLEGHIARLEAEKERLMTNYTKQKEQKEIQELTSDYKDRNDDVLNKFGLQ